MYMLTLFENVYVFCFNVHQLSNDFYVHIETIMHVLISWVKDWIIKTSECIILSIDFAPANLFHRPGYQFDEMKP